MHTFNPFTLLLLGLIFLIMGTTIATPMAQDTHIPIEEAKDCGQINFHGVNDEDDLIGNGFCQQLRVDIDTASVAKGCFCAFYG
jgi:hypothetical protein